MPLGERQGMDQHLNHGVQTTDSWRHQVSTYIHVVNDVSVHAGLCLVKQLPVFDYVCDDIIWHDLFHIKKNKQSENE